MLTPPWNCLCFSVAFCSLDEKPTVLKREVTLSSPFLLYSVPTSAKVGHHRLGQDYEHATELEI